MDIKLDKINQVVVVSVSGSIDALNAQELTDCFLRQIEAGAKNFVLDLSQLDFMSSAGLRAILTGVRKARQNAGDLHLAAAQPGVENVLNVSGFASILNTYSDVQKAVAEFSS